MLSVIKIIGKVFLYLLIISNLFINLDIYAALLPPNLLIPINNDLNTQLKEKFVWESVPNTKIYHFQLSKFMNFSNIIIDQSGIQDTSFRFGILEHNTIYYWRVRAGNYTETSNWSNWMTFKTVKLDFDIGLISLYAFEDIMNMGKDSKNINNGVTHGGVSIANGVIGKAVQFDGKTGYIEIPQSPSFLSLKNMSVLYWTKYYKPVSGPSNVGTTICNGTASPRILEDGFTTWAYTDFIQHVLGNWWEAKIVWVNIPFTGKIPLNKQDFGYVSFIVDDTILQGYKNSCFIEQNYRKGIQIPRSQQNWYLGDDNKDNYLLEGLLDELRIYNRPMPEEEIRELYRLNGGAVLITSSEFLNFGEHLCPIDSVLQIDFLNTGTAPLKLEQIYLNGGNKSVFSYLGKNNYIVDTNGVEKVLVSYQPQNAGDFIDTLVIETPNACPKKIPLFGKIIGINYEILGLTKDTLTFTLKCGEMQKDTSFSIINHTKATIPFKSSSLSLPFSLKDPAVFPVNVNSEEKKDIWVHFETSDTGKYIQQFNIIDTCGIVRTIYLKAVVHGGFKVVLSGGDIFCKGDSSIIKAPGGYQDYVWYDAETGEKFSGNGSSLTTYKPGRYYAKMKNSSGCEGISDTITINAMSGVIYDILGVSNDTLDFNLKCGEMLKDTVFSIVNHNMGTTFESSTLTMPFSLKNSSIFPLYLKQSEKRDIWVHWESSDTGKYIQKLDIIDTCGNVRTIYLKAVVRSGFKPVLSGGWDLMCPGDSTVISAQGGYSEYVWYDAETGERVSGNDSSLVVFKSGKYYAKMKNSDGCEGISDTVSIATNGINYEILGTTNDTLDFNLKCGEMLKDTVFSIINHSSNKACFKSSSLNLPFSFNNDPVFPLELKQNEKQEVSVHFETKDTGTYVQKLQIIDTCGNIRIIYLRAVVRTGFKTALSGSGDILCEGDSSIIKAPGGYEDYEWYNLETGEKVASGSDSLIINNPGKYYAKMKDSYGCEGFSDTLEINSSGGSYLEVTTSDGKPELDFDSTYYPKVICRTIKIKNLSNQPYILNDILIFKNISFSIPQSQLPKLIPGNDSCEILVCYSPSEFGMETDSLFIDDSCVIHKVPLKAVSLKDEYSGDSKCNVMLRGKIRNLPNKFLLSISEPYPNPATDLITLGLVVRNDGSGFPEATMFNMYGNIIFNGERLISNESSGKIQHLSYKFNIEGLSSGIYFIRMMVGDEYFTFPVLKME